MKRMTDLLIARGECRPAAEVSSAGYEQEPGQRRAPRADASDPMLLAGRRRGLGARTRVKSDSGRQAGWAV